MTDLDRLCQRMGLIWHYIDGAGKPQIAPQASRVAVLAAMGLDVTTEAQAAAALAALPPQHKVHIIAPDQADALTPPTAWNLTLEDGTQAHGGSGTALPPLPLGIHRLTTGGAVGWVLAAPRQLPLPARRWGVTAPLYGLWDGEQSGPGSYAQLGALAEGLGRKGASFIGINPIHAGFPNDPRAFSPYAPSHRRRWSVAHIDTRDLPGVPASKPGTAPEADAAVQPPPGLIDHDIATPMQNRALRAAYAAFAGDPAFDAWRAEQGAALHDFATHQALSDAFGPYWTDWPGDLQRPGSPATRAFADAHTDALRFHAWAQWLAERQLHMAQGRARAGGMGFGLYLDLAVGAHPAGAETWADPALFARGVSLGAPPDLLGPSGQRWNLAPLLPDALLTTGFAALAETLRQQLRFAGLLRIDHILGFERAFWLPDGLPGLYVAMPRDALLAIARIEAARAGATIIGEDLGTIPDGLRAALQDAGILGCRVAMFERDWQGDRRFLPASAYPAACLTSFATHDLPTWAGWRQGRDIDWRRDLDEMTGAEATAAHAARRADVAALDVVITGHAPAKSAAPQRVSPKDAAPENAVPPGPLEDPTALHGFLAQTPAALVALQAEDICGQVEQPNLPGTVYDHPNWRRRLPCAVSALPDHPGLAAALPLLAHAHRTET
ncbi:4-alpha-glucanotransferase [Roseicitreum antarcticum]|uniref:4-alpha-glucanotransferase n=1 Tax=Roseicitreum antarcticum TaxID=564137 RepID=A0A1H2XNM1_9RHOB|nr:4-alpha-glucanotransferase [Roseicitreum antarcticum]SDW94410.1 4-alpha-glucanotransferase [Roseicitreum antarcticum]